MTHWHDTMVDHPQADGAVYATGWTISGLAVLGTIVAVWVLGICSACIVRASHAPGRNAVHGRSVLISR